MTVLFCDLVGSSALAARLDPEDFAALLVAYRERCVAATTQHGGYISRYIGDGVLACFGYPRAMGRDAQSAVACGLAIAREISALARSTPLLGGDELAVRIGIETGLVLAGRLGPGKAMELDALVGTAPNTAARLQQLAPANQVVIGEAAHELVSADFVCEELPQHRLAQPQMRAFAIRGELARQGQPALLTRRRSLMVGRVPELAALHKRWLCASTGEGQIILISGEPGMGKSRLTQELLDRIGDTPQAVILLHCAPAATATALFPAIEALRRALAASVESSDGRLTIQQALAELTAAIGLDAGPTLEVLTEALGLMPVQTDIAPAARRRLLLHAMQAWLLYHSEIQPLLIIAEDLHWSDPSLLELLHSLTNLIPRRRAMLLATYRSHFVLPWPDRPATLRIALAPLDGLEAKRLVEALASNLNVATRDAILIRSDGIPLFLEEFALAAGTPTIPRTLQQLFTARLDGLGQAKRLAQCAAVLGREMEADLLAALADLPIHVVDEQLAKLVNVEILVRITPPPSAVYTFRHALLQQAVSEAVLLVDRRLLHSRVAALLPRLRPALVERQPELLAEHHEAAGELAAAVPHYVEAARRALGTAALQEAEAQVRRGLTAIKLLPKDTATEAELDLRLLLGHVLIARRGYASTAVQEAFEAALEVAEQVQEETRSLAPLRGLASFYQVRGPLSRAEAICTRLVTSAERLGDTCILIDAWRRRGWNRGCMGRLVEAEEDLLRVVAAFEPARLTECISVAGQDPLVLSLANLCWLDPPRYGIVLAAQRARLAAEAAYASPHPVSACYGFVFAALTLQRAGHWDEARSLAERALNLAAEKGIAYWVAMSHVAIGFDRVARRGDAAAGREAIREGLASYRQTQGELLRPFILSLLARADAILGDVEAAWATLREAVEVAEALEAYGQVPELLLCHAQMLSGIEYRQERQELLRRALAAAQHQGASAVARSVAEASGLT